MSLNQFEQTKKNFFFQCEAALKDNKVLTCFADFFFSKCSKKAQNEKKCIKILFFSVLDTKDKSKPAHMP